MYQWSNLCLVVNVMLSWLSVMSPPHALGDLSVHSVVKFWSELGFLNCDDICMCVVNEQFELHEVVFDSVYVELQYNEISFIFYYWVYVMSVVVVLGLSVRLSLYHM